MKNNKKNTKHKNKKKEATTKETILGTLGLIFIFTFMLLEANNSNLIAIIKYSSLVIGCILSTIAGFTQNMRKAAELMQITHQKSNVKFDHNKITLDLGKEVANIKWREITKHQKQGNIVLLYNTQDIPIVIHLAEISSEERYLLDSMLKLYG